MTTAADERRVQKLQAEFEAIIASDPTLREVFQRVIPRQANYSYYTAGGIGEQRLFDKRGNAIYCYSTERVHGKYASWRYVCQKAGGSAVIKDRRSHARRKDAKARALAMCKEARKTV